MSEQGINMLIIGASYLLEEEEIMQVKALQQERKFYARSKVNIYTMKCLIDKAYAEEDEAFTATKTMIYKSIKIHGYFIDNVDNNNEKQLMLTIKTTKEQSETVYKALSDFDIDIIDAKEEVLEVTNQERAEIFDKFKERITLLKNEYSKIIKLYTWTETNKMAELEKINSFEDKTIQIINISTESITTTLPDRDDKYYTLLRNIRIILQDVEFTIIEDTEDNIYNVIWHRLNNKSIDITFKGSNITSLKQQHQLFIYFRMENVTIEEGNLDEIKRVLYINANESIVYIHEITPTEIEHIYNITGFAKQDQFNTYSKHMATFSIATDVIGATNIHTSNGQALMITLKKERKKTLCYQNQYNKS